MAVCDRFPDNPARSRSFPVGAGAFADARTPNTSSADGACEFSMENDTTERVSDNGFHLTVTPTLAMIMKWWACERAGYVHFSVPFTCVPQSKQRAVICFSA